MNINNASILILVLILLFLLMKNYNKSESLESQKSVGSHNNLGGITHTELYLSGELNKVLNGEIFESNIPPSDKNLLRKNVYCNNCYQDNDKKTPFKCNKCSFYRPNNYEFLKNYKKAEEQMKSIDQKYTDGKIDELDFHMQVKDWFSKYKNLTLFSQNYKRLIEIIIELQIYEEKRKKNIKHDIFFKENEFDEFIPYISIAELAKINEYIKKNKRIIK